MVRDLRNDLDMINFFKRDSQIKFGLSWIWVLGGQRIQGGNWVKRGLGFGF